jgi:hypothetical protein
MVRVKLRLICSGEPVSTLTVEGNKSDKVALVKRLVEAVRNNSENKCKAEM